MLESAEMNNADIATVSATPRRLIERRLSPRWESFHECVRLFKAQAVDTLAFEIAAIVQRSVLAPTVSICWNFRLCFLALALVRPPP